MWKVIGIVFVIIALGFRPLFQVVYETTKSPLDPTLGTLPLANHTELTAFYGGTRTLVVGGTRGIGRGIARVIFESGGNVVLVGRSTISGQKAVANLEKGKNAGTKKATVSFLPGDLGSVRSARELIHSLESVAKTQGKFDYLVVTAAVFPDWGDLFQEDGLEKGHAIAVVGRYMLYRYMNLFLKEGARVLNVGASGSSHVQFERALVEGKRNCTGLFECILDWSTSLDLMQIGLQGSGHFHKTTRVTTNPGLLSTDLHTGQGWLMDTMEPFMVALVGISEEICGERQATILASPRLHKERLSIFDDYMKGRLPSRPLQELVETQLPWLMSWLNNRTNL